MSRLDDLGNMLGKRSAAALGEAEAAAPRKAAKATAKVNDENARTN